MTLLMIIDPYHCCPPSLRSVLNQLMACIARRNCLMEHQHGNKKQYTTETLNIFMSVIVIEAIDRKQITALVLLDLSKAFDGIDHKILLSKLPVLGVSRKAIEWFKNYLSNRTQCVAITKCQIPGRWRMVPLETNLCLTLVTS